MDIKQVKSDFENGVLISRATLGALIDYALAASRADRELSETVKAARQRIYVRIPSDANDFNADALGRVLADMAIERQTFDSTKRINANIDAQMAKAEELRLAKRDRRVQSVPVEFDRRASAEDRRSAVRRLDLRRSEDK